MKMHKRRPVSFLAALLLIGALLLSACSGGGGTSTDPGTTPDPGTGDPSAGDSAGTPKAGGILRFGISRDPIGMDPNIGYGVSSASLQGNIYDTLVEFTADGSVVPSLAEEVETPDATTYIFHLRKGVVWHDGSPFTSADVKYTLDRVRNPDNALTRQREMSIIESIETPDDHTVIVKLSEPSPAFLNVLAGREMYIANAAWMESNDPVKGAMGTGPFRLESYDPGAEYVLVKNENYWKEGMPYLDKLVLIPYQEDGARVNALRGGEVDMIEYVPWTDIALLERDGSYKTTIGYDSFTIVRINHNVAPFNDERVRQALNYIVDRDEIIAIAFGGYGNAVTGGLLPADHWAHNADLVGTYGKDWDKARELLTAAGVDPAQTPLKMTSSVLTYHNDPGQAVMAQLKAFGFPVEYDTIETAQLLEKRQNGDYMLLTDGLGFSWPDPDAYGVYFGTGGSGHARGVNFSDPVLDELLARGRATVDPEERKAVYRQFEERLLEQAPWIFLLYRPQAEAMASYVEGFVRLGAGLGTESVGRFEYVWLSK